MKEELLNIVALIVRHMSEGGQDSFGGRAILDGLMEEGYDPVDIDDALSWFESLAGAGEELGGVEFWDGFKGFRVQGPFERETLACEAFAYLMRLNRSGLVDDQLREAVLDKVCELSMPSFGIEELKALLGLVLQARGGAGTEDVFNPFGERGSESIDH